jgi:hypothetical protein
VQYWSNPGQVYSASLDDREEGTYFGGLRVPAITFNLKAISASASHVPVCAMIRTDMHTGNNSKLSS